jgi:hypothetical protein
MPKRRYNAEEIIHKLRVVNGHCEKSLLFLVPFQQLVLDLRGSIRIRIRRTPHFRMGLQGLASNR